MSNSHKKILAIADRIDAAVEGMVELPKDVDGEYIHMGDVLIDDAEFESEGKVVRLMLENVGWLVGFDGCVRWATPSIHEWHHYHAPTVEDVLHEFICDHEEGVRDEVDLIAEYATKLQLKEN